jgi:hypothetical protein
MTIEEQSMKEVVRRLRFRRSKAVAELAELHAAMREMLVASERIAATIRDLADEAQALADNPAVGFPAPLRHLAEHAREVSTVVEFQIVAFRGIKHGLDGWEIQGSAS